MFFYSTHIQVQPVIWQNTISTHMNPEHPKKSPSKPKTFTCIKIYLHESMSRSSFPWFSLPPADLPIWHKSEPFYICCGHAVCPSAHHTELALESKKILLLLLSLLLLLYLWVLAIGAPLPDECHRVSARSVANWAGPLAAVAVEDVAGVRYGFLLRAGKMLVVVARWGTLPAGYGRVAVWSALDWYWEQAAEQREISGRGSSSQV